MFSNESGTKSQLNNCVFLKECVYCKLFNCLSFIELINSAYLFIIIYDLYFCTMSFVYAGWGRMRAAPPCGSFREGQSATRRYGILYINTVQMLLIVSQTKDCTVSLRTPIGIIDNAFCSTLLVFILIKLLSYLCVLKWPPMKKKHTKAPLSAGVGMSDSFMHGYYIAV